MAAISDTDINAAPPSEGAAPTAAPPALRRAEWLWLLALLVVAFVMRLRNIGVESLWFDELCTWRFATYPTIGEVIQKGAIEDFHPPGYVLFMHYWIKFFGDSEAMLRMPAAIAGALSVPALFLLGRKILSVRTGLASAVLLALTVAPIDRSQEARAYTILLLFAIVSTSLWVDVVRAAFHGARLPAWRLVALLASMFALMYAHYYGMFLVLLQIGAFVALAGMKRQAYRWAGGFAAFFILALLPWNSGLRHHLAMGEGWITRVPFFEAVMGFLAFIYGFAPATGLILLGLAILALVPRRLGPWMENTARQQQVLWFIAAWLVVPFLLVEIKSLVSTPIFWPRYLVISMPAAMLLAGHALARLRGSVAIPVALAAALAGAMWLLYQPQFLRREPWRTATQEVIARSAPVGSTGVLVISEKMGVGDYYFGKLAPNLPVFHASVGPKGREFEIAVDSFLKLAQLQPDFLWVMEAHPGKSKVLSEEIILNVAEIGTRVDGFMDAGFRAALFRIDLDDEGRLKWSSLARPAE